MKIITGGLRMALKYAFIMLVSGVFLLQCANVSETPPLIQELDAAPGKNILSSQALNRSGQMGQQRGEEKIPLNFKIVLRNVIDDDHRHDRHHDDGRWSGEHAPGVAGERGNAAHHAKAKDGHHKKDSYENEPAMDAVVLTVKRVEVLSSQNGWMVLYDAIVNGYTQEISLQPGTETEIFQSIVENGEYLRVKIFFVETGYTFSAMDRGTIYPILWKKGDRHHDEDGRHGDDFKNHNGDSENKGRQLKIKRSHPVSVEEGNITTLYFDIEPDEFVEYEKKWGAYFIDPEAKFAGSEITPLPAPKVDGPIIDVATLPTR